MNFRELNKSIENKEIILKPVSQRDIFIIRGMFREPLIKLFYVVPKEIEEDYEKLIDLWILHSKTKQGNCWVIYEKESGLFLEEMPVGIIAFEFKANFKNAKISYAILPEHRGKGFATNSVKILIDVLKNKGVNNIEADVDNNNNMSKKVLEKNGFSPDEKKMFIDPQLLKKGEIRKRTLWVKSFFDTSESQNIEKIELSASINEIVIAINKLITEIKDGGQQPSLLARYYYLLGRFEFLQGAYKEARESFAKSNAITENKKLPELHENYYWFGKINEAKGEYENAQMYFKFALENYTENPNYITKSEIEQEID